MELSTIFFTHSVQLPPFLDSQDNLSDLSLLGPARSLAEFCLSIDKGIGVFTFGSFSEFEYDFIISLLIFRDQVSFAHFDQGGIFNVQVSIVRSVIPIVANVDKFVDLVILIGNHPVIDTIFSFTLCDEVLKDISQHYYILVLRDLNLLWELNRLGTFVLTIW